MERARRRIAIALLITLAGLPGLAAGPAGARDLFQKPGLFNQPRLFDVPAPTIQTPNAPSVPGLAGNQCRVLTGTCPTGRLERIGTTCFCNTAGGAKRQGTTETRPQGTFKTSP